MIRKIPMIFLLFSAIIFLSLCTLVDSDDTEGTADNTPWHTYFGSGMFDIGYDVFRDTEGNIYVTGYSRASWGSPVNAYSGEWEAFIACLDKSGNLIWNTFLGCSEHDVGHGITKDSTGKIYLCGYSHSTWGSPLRSHMGGASDGFIACLDGSGQLLWNTFLGSGGSDSVRDIKIGSSGSIFVVGQSTKSWGSPIHAHSHLEEGFVACLNSSGNIIWNTFLGGSYQDYATSIQLDSSGKIFVSGTSYSSWGSPIDNHSGNDDVFVACLNSTGNRLWNTFIGSAQQEQERGLALDSSGNIYVTGLDNINSGNLNFLLASLDNSGNLLWKKALGSGASDSGLDIQVSNTGNFYVTGRSYGSWGSPISPYKGDSDAFVACFNSLGNLLWNTFIGTSGWESGHRIQLDTKGNFYIMGGCYGSWGSPVNAYKGGGDVFVLKDRVDQ